MTDNLITDIVAIIYNGGELTTADRFKLVALSLDLHNEAKKAQNAAVRNAELHDIALEDVRMLQDDRRDLRAELRAVTELATALYERNRELVAINHELTAAKLGITI
jgi:hypothetical protein